jgi:hypothetical protein
MHPVPTTAPGGRGMRLAGWVLAAAAILARGAPPCGAERGKKAPPPKTPAPAPKPAEAGPGLREAEAAFRRRNYAEAEVLADAALLRKPDREERMNLLHLSASAKLLTHNFVGCLGRTEQIRKVYEGARFPLAEMPEFLAPLLEFRAEALLGLGREEDARGLLAELRASAPGAWDLHRAAFLESVLRASGPVHVDFAYEGKDRNSPDLDALKKRAAGSLPKAIHRVRYWLEAPDLEFPPLVLRFGDDDWHGNEDSSAAAWATDVVRGGTVVGVVTVGVEALLEGQFEGNGILAHELGHTLRRKGCPGSRAAVWLEEGIAHWISGDIDLELPGYVLGWWVCPSHFSAGGGWPEFPLRSIPETEAAVAALGDDAQRLCGVLLFEHLERTRGLKNMRKLVRALLTAADPSAVIREETGKSTDEIFAAVSRGLAAWERRAWYDFEDLEAIRALLHETAWEAAERKCRKYAEDRPASMLLPVAKRALFVALHNQGKAAEARQVLNDATAEHRGPVHPWLLLEDLRLARQAGNAARVLTIGRLIQAERTALDNAARAEVVAAIEEARGGGGGK